MELKKFFIGTASLALAGCAIILAVFYFRQIPQPTAPAPVAPAERLTIGWKNDFASLSMDGNAPEGWKLQGKPGTRPAVFTIETDQKTGDSFLRMEADDASASLVTRVGMIDLEKTPVLRWRWRATTLPTGADGRVKRKDDQAIGIYVGTGSVLDNRSVSYRWDTNTPKGAEGSAAYGLGGIKVKWFTLRNKEDAGQGEWFVEERNIAEDFKEAWGYYPDKLYVSVSSNSQYTDSMAAADLGWIEFTSIPSK